MTTNWGQLALERKRGNAVTKIQGAALTAGGLLLAAAVVLAVALPGRAAAAEGIGTARLAQEEALETEEESGVTLEALRSISFTDVAGEGPAQDAVRYVAYFGIMEGVGEGTLRPGQPPDPGAGRCAAAAHGIGCIRYR